jgi:hypothetical protein
MTQDSTHSPFNVTSVPVQTSTLAITSLVTGIACWFVLPLIGALIAVITGHMAKKEIRESAGRLSGLDLANAGLVLGYVHLAISAIGVCLGIMFFAGLCALIFGTAEWSSSYIRIIPW